MKKRMTGSNAVSKGRLSIVKRGEETKVKVREPHFFAVVVKQENVVR